QQATAQDEFLRQVLEVQVGLEADLGQVRIDFLAGRRNAELEAAMEIAERLQLAHVVEELGEQHALVDAVAQLDELVLGGVPHRQLEAFVDQRATAAVDQPADATCLGHVLDDAAEH